MSNSARSVYYFGFYIALIGVVLVFVPNPLLGLAGVPATTEVWIHLAGMLLIFMGFFYIMAGRENVTAFFRWTLVTRSIAVFFVLGFMVMKWISPVILLFWLGDLAGAIWTLLALHSEGFIKFPWQHLEG